MTILISDNLSKSFGARLIFKSITFSVGQGERMCVIGRNGEGKTTLLRVIAGELEQDEGSFQVTPRDTAQQRSPCCHTPTIAGCNLDWRHSHRIPMYRIAR